LVVEDVLSKINPDNGVEAIKGMQDATLTVSWRPNGPSLETSIASKIIILLTS
jgi:hypothetical protein